MPTTVTKTVKSAGGDYSSLAAALTALGTRNLVTNDELWFIDCYAMADTGGAAVVNCGDDATRYLTIRTPSAERHTGVPSSGYRLRVEDFSEGLYNNLSLFTRVDGIAFYFNSSSGRRAFGTECYNAASDIRFSNGLVAGTAGTNRFAIATFGSATNFKVWNTIIYTTDGGITVGANGNIYIYNCTVKGCAVSCYDQTAGTVICKNCIADTTGTSAWSGSFSASSNYNATNKGTATGGANDRVSQTFTYANAGSNDYKLGSGDTAAKDLGTNLSGDANLPFSDDIIGTSRPQGSAWDIGASEVISGGGGGATNHFLTLMGVGA